MKTTKTKWFASVSLTKLSLVATGMFLAATSSAVATVRYVNVNNPSPTPPYTNWATAATNIQNAVDAAAAGDQIVVTNGIYATGSTQVGEKGFYDLVVVAVDKPLTVQSVNGPSVTVINGGGTAGCVYLATNAVMVGFTLTNGVAIYGGGVYCESTNAVLSNCVVTGNSTWNGGGGTYGGTLNSCTLTGNSAPYGYGGGAADCTLNNCTLSGNSTSGGGSGGGGAIDCTLNNCTLTGNSALGGYGGGAESSTLNSCSLSGNSAVYGGGAGDSTLNNCTLTGNSAVWGGGVYSCTLNNCIVYFNSAPVHGNYDPYSTLNYCCTTPTPTNGVGNISADPEPASASHLSALSPCIGAGSAAYASGTDIDGEAWANPPSIGCDEYHAGAVTGPLTVSLTATYTNVATGFPVSLTALIDGRTDLSVWDFGDGYVQVNEPYTSHTWTAPGDYLVALWAFNDSYPEGVSAAVTVHVEAEVLHYVAATSSNPVAPYTSWATAATNIQDAVDAAAAGDQILVTNGTYASGSRVDTNGQPNCVLVDKPLVLSSVNGPDVTLINGGGAVRCLYLTKNTLMVGFTLTNGVSNYGTGGGGVFCESTNAVLTNCVLTGNSAWGAGGGACGGTLNNCTLTGNSANGYGFNEKYPGTGGGAYSCTLNNCTLTGNWASGFSYGPFGDYYCPGVGGGAADCTLNNCTLSSNSADYGGGAYSDSLQPCILNYCTLTGNSAYDGGGAADCTLNNCTLSGNWATFGGGVCDSTLNNCTLTGNSAYYGGGAAGGTLNNCTLTGNLAPGGGGGAWNCTLNNCTLTGNSGGGQYGGGGAGFSTLNNCTLTGNSAPGSYGGGAFGCSMNNCIVYFNSAANGANYYQYGNELLSYCCTPMPYNGIGNITNAPLFVNYAGGNLRLQSNSPCINSGNNAFVVGSTDLDGNPRIVGGTVDIGAYEYQSPTSIISYAWLQQYGLPTDGSADHADLDGTGMNVYQDWVAGLNPTNALSVLKMLAPVKTNNPAGLVVTWQSVNTRTYYLQRSTNLAEQPAFITIQSNIVGQAGTTSYTDTTATNAGPYFYRVGVGN